MVERNPIVIAALVATAVASGVALARTTAARIGNGVVVIKTNLAYQGGTAAGTGMVLTSSGEILTNNHVIRGASRPILARGPLSAAAPRAKQPPDGVGVPSRTRAHPCFQNCPQGNAPPKRAFQRL
jgi:S1-C subfamily serine protease